MDIEFNGFPLGPHHPNCQCHLVIIGPPSAGRTFDPAGKERAILKYLWRRIAEGREYVSLTKMARETGLSYDDCERLVAEAHVNKKIPRLTILEEVEG